MSTRLRSWSQVRILAVDDDETIRESYVGILGPRERTDLHVELDTLESELFGNDRVTSEPEEPEFDLTVLGCGEDAVIAVRRALEQGSPFHVVFIDMRMPPGMDGRDTARHIRKLDPDVNIVIVTGFSDHSVLDISRVVSPPDKLFYITKPFETSEVRTMALALATRWRVDHDLSTARTALADKIRQLEEQGALLAANEARANHAANHDALTGAPNRQAFLRELHHRIGEARASIGICVIDIDSFRNINDSLGLAAGDLLIRRVYQALSEVQLPDSDVMVARLGGDEFAICFDVTDASVAHAYAADLIRHVSSDVEILGKTIRISISVGIHICDLCDDSRSDEAELLRLADLALQAARRAGHGQLRLFEPAFDESLQYRQTIESGLRRAIERNELSLVFQPIVSREPRHIAGFEALLRWNSGEFGPVSPTVFIPIAEESDLIISIGEWVMEHAVAECRNWQHQYVSINVSRQQFRHAAFMTHLVDYTRAAGLSPERVQIEVTETALFDDMTQSLHMLEQLRGMGFLVALDEFGSGYWNFYNVRNFSLSCLKIDKSFIDGIGIEAESRAIVEAVTHLAHALGLDVVAEGVETASQEKELSRMKCSHMQGYFFSRPVSAIAARLLASDSDEGFAANTLAAQCLA